MCHVSLNLKVCRVLRSGLGVTLKLQQRYAGLKLKHELCPDSLGAAFEGSRKQNEKFLERLSALLMNSAPSLWAQKQARNAERCPWASS